MPLFPRPEPRLVSPLVVAGALAAAAFPAPAVAQETFDIGGDLEMILELPDGDDYTPPNPPDIIEFMNRANCACGDDEESKFGVKFRLNNPANELPDEELQLWLGVTCNSTDPDIQDRCQRIEGFSDLEELRAERDRLISVRDLISKDGTCPEQDNERSVYAIVDEDGNGFSDGDYSQNLEIPTDTRPPPEPTLTEVLGGEDSITIEWDPPASTEDIWYYQALCLREDGQPGADDGGDPEYLTAKRQCGVDDGTCVRATSVARALARGGVDGGIDADAGVDPDAGAGDPDAGAPGSACADVPQELAELDPALLCGTQAAPASSLKIDGLENGVTYRVVLLVIDRARNVTALDAGSATPAPVIDFWEDYKAQGGRAKGGCGVGQAGPGAGFLLGLGLALWAGAALRRGRRRRRGRGAAALVLLVGLGLAPSLARAQPWWEGYEDPVQAEVGPAAPRWNLELKLGPYVPDIDSEFDLGPDEAGPVERMFGDGPFLLGGITLDRYLLHPLGQLGVSASLGFLTRSANAFALEDGMTVDNNRDGKPDRAVGNTTTLRLFPASLGVVYRFTELDDRFRVPLVPYGRLGLSYYYWWITRPSGGTAEVPTPDCPDLQDCEGDSGRGGSLGWQATVGVAIRAERIDPDAEQSLRNELGIEHAGLVVEYTYAVVDGFGSDEKLSVGDATWFGGLNFEF